jgi:hypothetical protein
VGVLDVLGVEAEGRWEGMASEAGDFHNIFTIITAVSQM